MSRRRRIVAWSAVAAVLGMVFVAYRQPGLIVDLANQVWNCF